MAKQSTKDGTALAERPKNTAIERPAFIKAGDTRGTENIGSADIRPPSLRVAQGGSPQVKRQDEANYVEGLSEGDLFITPNTILGEDPVDIVVVHQLGHRHVEFAPMDAGGGVVDFNVPDGDPRTEFTTENVDGKQVRVKPIATKFYDYLVLVDVPGEGRKELCTLSLKSTQLKVAVGLNTDIKKYKLPSFAHTFKVTPVPERRGSYSFYGLRIERTGFVDEATYKLASDTYDTMAGKTIVVETEHEEREPGSDDM